MGEQGSSLLYFSGEDADYREYKRWKQWAVNKMATMDKLTKEARGPFLWTLLRGKALEAVEHLQPEAYHKEGGEKAILALLDKRWPEVEKTAELGEHITKVFTIKAQEGETLRQWAARAAECFDACNRKCGVKFPDEAKGWILLLWRADTGTTWGILARAQGSLKFDDVSQSMRSCFPDHVIPKKYKQNAVNVVEANPDAPFLGDHDDAAYADFELREPKRP